MVDKICDFLSIAIWHVFNIGLLILLTILCFYFGSFEDIPLRYGYHVLSVLWGLLVLLYIRNVCNDVRDSIRDKEESDYEM